MLNLDDTLRKDLRKAKKIITNSGSTIFVTNKYDLDKPYWAATQNLNYISDLSKKKDINRAFTILGSSDNIFELVRLGVPNIVATDINTFAKYIFYLKKAAIKTLSVKEYISFLLEPTSEEFFKRAVFEKKVIYGFNSDEEQYKEFWFNMFKYYDKRDILDSFVNSGFKHTKGEDRVNFMTYIQNKKYEQVRENLTKTSIEIYDEDALEVLKNLENELFDWIDITNILLWVFQFDTQEDITLFRKYVEDLEAVIRERLSESGIFAIDYMFKTQDPKGLLKESIKESSFLMNRINEVYSIIFRTINDYFSISTLKYRGVPSSLNSLEYNKVTDQLVLARIKK